MPLRSEAPHPEQHEQRCRKTYIKRQFLPDERHQQEMMDQNKDDEREQYLHLQLFSQKYFLFFTIRCCSLKKWRRWLKTLLRAVFVV